MQPKTRNWTIVGIIAAATTVVGLLTDAFGLWQRWEEDTQDKARDAVDELERDLVTARALVDSWQRMGADQDSDGTHLAEAERLTNAARNELSQANYVRSRSLAADARTHLDALDPTGTRTRDANDFETAVRGLQETATRAAQARETLTSKPELNTTSAWTHLVHAMENRSAATAWLDARAFASARAAVNRADAHLDQLDGTLGVSHHQPAAGVLATLVAVAAIVAARRPRHRAPPASP